MIDIRDSGYTELTIEFLASFVMDKKGIDYERPGVVQFHLGGKQFAMSNSEFGVALGLYTESFTVIKLYQNSVSYGSGSCAKAFFRLHARSEF